MTKGKSKDTDYRKRKERENQKTTASQTNRCQTKMENKEDDIEVNKISRSQMRRLKAKEKKSKTIK